jgi:hypothetical protein
MLLLTKVCYYPLGYVVFLLFVHLVKTDQDLIPDTIAEIIDDDTVALASTRRISDPEPDFYYNPIYKSKIRYLSEQEIEELENQPVQTVVPEEIIKLTRPIIVPGLHHGPAPLMYKYRLLPQPPPYPNVHGHRVSYHTRPDVVVGPIKQLFD